MIICRQFIITSVFSIVFAYIIVTAILCTSCRITKLFIVHIIVSRWFYFFNNFCITSYAKIFDFATCFTSRHYRKITVIKIMFSYLNMVIVIFTNSYMCFIVSVIRPDTPFMIKLFYLLCYPMITNFTEFFLLSLFCTSRLN